MKVLNPICSRTLWIFCLIIFFSPYRLAAQHILSVPHPVTIDRQDVEATKIIESSQGWIWLATPKGIIRHNGTQSDLFETPAAVTAIFEDQEKVLWLGLENGNIYQWEINDSLKPWSIEEGWPKVPITAFEQDDQGQMWIATYGEGVYVYSHQRLYNIDTSDGLLSNEIYTLAFDKVAHVWLGSDAGIHICSFSNQHKSIKNLTIKDGLPDVLIRCLSMDTRGQMWIGMYESGVCLYRLADSTLSYLTPGWSYGEVKSITTSIKDQWISTAAQGIYLLNLKNNKTTKLTIPHAAILQAYNDVEGHTWILTASTGILLAHRQFKIWPTGLSGIQALHTSRFDHRLYIGTKDGLYVQDNSGETFKKLSTEKLNILCLYEDNAANMWIGTYGQGLFCYNSNTHRWLDLDGNSALINNNIFSIEGKEDSLYLATLGGAYKLIISDLISGKMKSMINFNRRSGLTTDFIYRIHVDAKNRIWFGTDGHGVSMLDHNGFHNYRFVHDSISIGAVYTMAEDHNGQLWIGTGENKVYKFDQDAFIDADPRINAENRKIQTLVFNDYGHLLIIYSGGLEIYNPLSKQVSTIGSALNTIDFDPSMNAWTRNAEGDLFIGLQSQVLQFEMQSALTNIQPRLLLTGVSVFMVPMDHVHTSSFTATQNYLSFRYQGFWFNAPDLIQYRYKLEGLDPGWQYTKETQVTYPNLPAGAFKLIVQSSTDHNFTRPSQVEYSFTIQLPFWKEWWFFSLLILSMSGLVYGLMSHREKKLQLDAHLKKEKVQMQLDMLKSQINPHFLFNSFNTLIATIEDAPDKAVEYVEKLSQFFRNILTVREKSFITLEEELALLESYIYLIKQRHGADISITIQLKDKSSLIVPLTLQLLVENAVKHNVISRSRPLKISIDEYGEKYLRVQNNIQKKPEHQISTRFGLLSINKQYELLTHQPIKIEENQDFFSVCIPIVRGLLYTQLEK